MSEILSIQSHVTYGYVGNRAAVFPLQRLGFDVAVINTVQFSNHTGYGAWQGDVMTSDHIRKIINGLRDRDVLQKFQALLSGYMGDVALGEIILEVVAEIREKNSDFIYCCDPVMGDVGRGFFVQPGIPEFFKSKIIPHTDIITPNKFEAEFLSGVTINTLDDALVACETLIKLGPKIILITSLETKETPNESIQMLVFSKEEKFLITTPKFYFDVPPNGSGDMTAAIFLADYLQNKNVKEALEHVAASMYGIFKQTYDKKTRELQIISAQSEIVRPGYYFLANKI